jgi:hypothetical protein
VQLDLAPRAVGRGRYFQTRPLEGGFERNRWFRHLIFDVLPFNIAAVIYRRPVYAVLLLVSVADVSRQHVRAAEIVSLPPVCDRNTNPAAVRAPNGIFVLRVTCRKTGRLYPEDEWASDYFIEQDSRRLRPPLRPYNNPYVLWSPNSDLLAVGSSDGGSVGNWKVYVYGVQSGAVVKHDVMRPVQAEIARDFPGAVNPAGTEFFSQRERDEYARDPTWVNVFAKHWLRNPERLLVTAGVPPSSLYGANMGKMRGYIIDPRSGDILRRYTESQFRRVWPGYSDPQ